MLPLCGGSKTVQRKLVLLFVLPQLRFGIMCDTGLVV